MTTFTVPYCYSHWPNSGLGRFLVFGIFLGGLVWLVGFFCSGFLFAGAGGQVNLVVGLVCFTTKSSEVPLLPH